MNGMIKYRKGCGLYVGKSNVCLHLDPPAPKTSPKSVDHRLQSVKKTQQKLTYKYYYWINHICVIYCVLKQCCNSCCAMCGLYWQIGITLGCVVFSNSTIFTTDNSFHKCIYFKNEDEHKLWGIAASTFLSEIVFMERSSSGIGEKWLQGKVYRYSKTYWTVSYNTGPKL